MKWWPWAMLAGSILSMFLLERWSHLRGAAKDRFDKAWSEGRRADARKELDALFPRPRR